MARGWRVLVRDVAGLPRRVLWKGPEGAWTRGAMLVLHGGGGHHFQYCVANARSVEPQVRFTEQAVARGFAVFLLESSDQVTDTEGRACGKVWDDEVRARPNIDLPFIGDIMQSVIPALRPEASRPGIYVTGLSSGGYMTLRAATHFAGLVTAFAPVSSGDPYGWHRVCAKGMNSRDTVHGAGFDNDTGKQIIEPGSCAAERFTEEKPWDGGTVTPKPYFRLFHHRYDGVNDSSCADRAIKQLRDHGYPEVPALTLDGDRKRSLANHLWQDGYNEPLLDFFATQHRVR